MTNKETQKYIRIVQDKNKAWFVHLIGANGEVMMHSESYSTKSNAKKALNDLEIIFRRFLEYKGYKVTIESDKWLNIKTSQGTPQVIRVK